MNKQTTIIYLVRHGESLMNSQNIISGQLDTDLTLKGIRQVQQLARTLKSVNFDTVYSSDLKRALKTAKIIYKKPVPQKNRLEGLRERFNGELEGQPTSLEIPGETAKYLLPPEKRWLYRSVPGMENDQEIYARYMEALELIVSANKGKTILVVAHDDPIRTVLMKLKNLRHEDLPVGSFKNAGYVELTYTNTGFKVVKVTGVQL